MVFDILAKYQWPFLYNFYGISGALKLYQNGVKMVTVLWGCFHGDQKWYKNGRWKFVFETYGQQHGCSWTSQIQHTNKMVVQIPASTTNPFGDHLHLAIPTWPSIQAPRQHLQHILQSSLQPSLQAPIPQEAHPSLHAFSGQNFKSLIRHKTAAVNYWTQT